MNRRISVLALAARLLGLFVVTTLLPIKIGMLASRHAADADGLIGCGYGMLLIVMARKLDRLSLPDGLPQDEMLTAHAWQLFGLLLLIPALPCLVMLPLIMAKMIVPDAIAAQSPLWADVHRHELWHTLRDVSSQGVVLTLAGIALLWWPRRKCGVTVASAEGAGQMPETTIMDMASVQPALVETYICGGCGAAVAEHDVVCAVCGADVERVERFYCSTCGREIAENAPRCPYCAS